MKTKILALLVSMLAFVDTANAQLPDPGVTIEGGRTALLITDPQNDFLSPKGVTWGVVGKSVTENNTVENIESLFKTAKANDIPVFVSPHYYYPTDHGWHFEGALETLMHNIGMFDRKGALSVDGFVGSGADWLEPYKRYINDGQTVVTSPHKVYGPETNDVVLQLPRADFPAPDRETGLAVHYDDERVEIIAGDVNETVARLLEMGVTLEGLRIRSRTLEDLFLELTGKDLRA